jgi:chorismate-pyruvate lyase
LQQDVEGETKKKEEEGEDENSRPSCYREIRIWVGREPVVHAEMGIKPVN